MVLAFRLPGDYHNDPPTGLRVRWHLHESAVARAFIIACAQARLGKRATTHALRHSFATHLLEAGNARSEVSQGGRPNPLYVDA